MVHTCEFALLTFNTAELKINWSIMFSAALIADIHMGLNYPDLVLAYSHVHGSLWKSRGFR